MPIAEQAKKRGRPPLLTLPKEPLTSEPLPKSTFARLLGCRPPRITEWIRRGTIKAVTDDGWIIPTRAVVEMRAAGCFADGLGESRNHTRQTAAVPREVARLRLMLEASAETLAEEALRRLPPGEAKALVIAATSRTRATAMEALDRDVGPPDGFTSWAEHPFFDRPDIPEAQWAEMVAQSGSEPHPTPSEAAAGILLARGPTMSRAEAERVQANFKALIGQLEYEERVKQVIPTKQMEDVLGTVLTVTRTRILALPSRATPLVVGMTKPREVFTILTGLIHDVLTEISEFDIASAFESPSDTP